MIYCADFLVWTGKADFLVLPDNGVLGGHTAGAEGEAGGDDSGQTLELNVYKLIYKPEKCVCKEFYPRFNL